MSNIVSRNSIVRNGSNGPLPRDRYTLRCLKAEFGQSKSSGNPMITLKCEIVAPEEIEHGGTKYNISGRDVTFYASLSDKAIGDVFDLYDKFGQTLDTIDRENPDTAIFEGKTFDAILSAEEQFAQKMVAPGQYERIKDANGKDISQGYRVQAQIRDILGLNADAGVGAGRTF